MTAVAPPPRSPVVDHLLPVTRDEAAVLTRLAARVTADPIDAPGTYAQQVRALAAGVPWRLAETLTRFADHGSTTGVLVVRGLPVGPLPPTPTDNRAGLGGRTLLATQAALLAGLLGHQLGYQAEGHGHLWQDMVPSRERAATQQSQGSGVELEAHTEQAFSPLRPDHVLLACLRGDPDAVTYAFPARDLVRLLHPGDVAQLRRPLWRIAIDESFRPWMPDPAEVRGPVPILSGHPSAPQMVIDQDLMHGVTPAAQRLLERAIELYVAHRYAHVLEPGDVLLLDNRAAMHGRSPFRPRFDGRDRFIARGFTVRDLAPTAPARGGGRVVAAECS